LKQSYSLGRFEYFVLAIVIGGIATIALDRYLFLAEETRNLRFEMLAHHFAKGAANARINWIVQRHRQELPAPYGRQAMMLGEQLFYFSSQGWPVTTSGRMGLQSPQLADCYYLWQALLQNPPPIARDPEQKGQYEYYLATEKKGCRYYWNKSGSQNYYFEYNPWDGQVSLVIPEATESTIE
jgi:hypothetical protein